MHREFIPACISRRENCNSQHAPLSGLPLRGAPRTEARPLSGDYNSQRAPARSLKNIAPGDYNPQRAPRLKPRLPSCPAAQNYNSQRAPPLGLQLKTLEKKKPSRLAVAQKGSILVTSSPKTDNLGLFKAPKPGKFYRGEWRGIEKKLFFFLVQEKELNSSHRIKTSPYN